MEEKEWREEEKKNKKIKNKNRRKGGWQNLLWPVLCGLAKISCVGEQGVQELHGRGREVEIKSG